MMPIYLVIGVPGSGKSWVCNQLKDRFFYVPNDEFINHDYSEALIKASRGSDKPILADCPFGERVLKEKLEGEGICVLPFFIIEHPSIVQARYEARDKRPIPKAFITRAITIKARAEDWNATQGTAVQILRVLKDFPL